MSDSYQGPSIDSYGEQGRVRVQESLTRSSAWSQVLTESGTILSFEKGGNRCTVLMDTGLTFESLLVSTPLPLILFLWGEPDQLHNVPCTVTYRGDPHNGTVQLQSLGYVEESEDSRLVSEPFFM